MVNRKMLVLSLLVLVSAIPGVFAEGKADKKNVPAIIDIRVEKSREGTRSEARHYYLKVDGFNVPDVFSLIAVNNDVFTFESRQNLWGDDGYVPRKDYPLPYSIGKNSVEEGSLEQGWYLSDTRKKGTPGNWCYVEAGDLRAFVAPSELDNFAGQYDLESIPRDEGTLQKLE